MTSDLHCCYKSLILIMPAQQGLLKSKPVIQNTPEDSRNPNPSIVGQSADLISFICVGQLHQGRHHPQI